MMRKGRVLLFVLFPVLIAVTLIVWAAARAGPARRAVALPATTQFHQDPAGVQWNWPAGPPLAGAGLVDGRTWYIAHSYRQGLQRAMRGTLGTTAARWMNVVLGDIGQAAGNGALSFAQPITARPVVVDRVLYAATATPDVTAADLETRSVTWTANLGAPATGLAHADRRLLAVTGAGAAALDSDSGQVLWSYPSGAATTGAALDATYACYGSGDTLHVLDAAGGKPLRQVTVPGTWGDVVLDGKTAYVCGHTTTGRMSLTISAVDLPTGRIRWQWQEPGPEVTLKAWRPYGPVAGDGSLYITFADRLFAVDASSGRKRWEWAWQPNEAERPSWPTQDAAPPPGRRWRELGTPAVIGGVVYARSVDDVTGFDPATGREVWRFNAIANYGGELDLPPFAGNGVLFCSVGGYALCAVTDDLHPPVPTVDVTPAARALDTRWATAAASATALLLLVAIPLRRWRATLALASLGLFGLTVWAWRTSYQADHFIGWRTTSRAVPFETQTTRGVTSSRGGLTFGARHEVWEMRAGHRIVGNARANWLWLRTPPPDAGWRNPSLGMTDFRWVRRSRPSGTALGNQAQTSLTVPHWLVAAMLAILPLAWLSGAWRDRRRHPPGCCQRCGYDLRASAERCPECGDVATAAAAVATTPSSNSRRPRSHPVIEQ